MKTKRQIKLSVLMDKLCDLGWEYTCNRMSRSGMQTYDEILQYGVDEIYCLSMNDPFVQNVWKEKFKIKKVKFIPDGNGEFTKAMNMLTNRSEAGMGIRSFRYSMYVNDMNILKLLKDENGKFDVSDSNTMINYLKTLNE